MSLASLLRQLPRSSVSLPHGWIRLPFSGDQRSTQSKLQRKLPLCAPGSVWQSPEHRDSFGKVRHGFYIG
jgi:hypothetical protein